MVSSLAMEIHLQTPATELLGSQWSADLSGPSSAGAPPPGGPNLLSGLWAHQQTRSSSTSAPKEFTKPLIVRVPAGLSDQTLNKQQLI